ncbi:hypothetical protein Back11_51870 [Paenibacillus baekrokdamisoli]|uniref:Uncharacterized protein n=1 Tax=Paenibacillus baekrokdamisoli TaxID=1712516 RepID=A0A3G9IZW3_9BACL|nr:hypothetical protein [Paenibacillus baekrokdamisoli]MBB3069021.1 putative membrane protein YgcG [Paenibacillus baekrokdamisoli]BBH23842.1 hypothetical protein Back11_51870 [Paenibacillus baekrokdamisoli]
MGSSIFGLFFVIVIIVIVVGIILQLSKSGSRFGSPQRGPRRRISLPNRKPPEFLGVPKQHPARAVSERLEAVLTVDFEERIKDRVLKINPAMREGEWQWQWFELKRYFLMCAILRGVPMYSVKVDVVWHEMLMFTREYEQFCKQLCGGLIHHAPHAADAKPDPGERAWFDWVYGELFESTPVSGQLWGSFYRVPLQEERIRDLDGLSREQLKDQLFNHKAAELFPDIHAAAAYLIDRGKRLATEARRGDRRSSTDDSAYQSQWQDASMMTGLLSGAFFFSSLHDSGDFNRQMDDAQTKEQREHNSSCGSSSYVCSSDNNGGHNCSSSSCSSGGGDGGSSCGGSSCGGGGCGGGGGD